MSPDFAAYGAKCAAVAGLQAEILPSNKAALFRTLSDTGIRTVLVNFDGCGDSGQIESIVARNAEGVEVEMPLRDLIERMAYDFLE